MSIIAETKLSHKIQLGFFSLILTVIVLEITLRLGGALLLHIQENKNKQTFQLQDSYRILCLGESTTYMGGDFSYPSQLHEILNNSREDKKFSVINKGIPGIGTKHIVANIDAWIEQYNPDIAVVMMGINDHNENIPVDQITLEKSKLSFIRNSRTFKLLSWIQKGFAQRIKKTTESPEIIKAKETPHVTYRERLARRMKDASKEDRKLMATGLALKSSRKFDEPEKAFRTLLTRDLKNIVRKGVSIELAETLIAQEKYSELMPVIEFLLEKDPYNPWVAEWTHGFCTKNQGVVELTNLLKFLIEKEPEQIPYYDLLSGCYRTLAMEEQAKEYSAKAKALRLQRLNPITKSNYVKLNEKLRKRNVKIVYVQYPLRDLDALKLILQPEVELDDVSVVDNEKSFEEALKTADYDDYFTDRFAGDFGHCTPRGNKLLAQNIATTILNEVIKK